MLNRMSQTALDSDTMVITLKPNHLKEASRAVLIISFVLLRVSAPAGFPQSMAAYCNCHPGQKTKHLGLPGAMEPSNIYIGSHSLQGHAMVGEISAQDKTLR